MAAVQSREFLESFARAKDARLALAGGPFGSQLHRWSGNGGGLRSLDGRLRRQLTMRPVEQLRAVLSRLPDVEQSYSRFGSHHNPAWSVSGREFAHLHADDLLDLRLPRAIQNGLRADPKAHFRKTTSHWLEFEFHTMEDVVHLEMLAREAWAAARKSRK